MISNENYKKLTEYFYSLGEFGELNMIVLVAALTYNHPVSLGLYVIGLGLNNLLNGLSKDLAYASLNVFYSIVYLYLTLGYFMPWTFMGLVVGSATIYQQQSVHANTTNQLLAGAVAGSAMGYFIISVKEYVITNYINVHKSLTLSP